MMREALTRLEKALSRRAFLATAIRGGGAIAALDRFGEGLFGFADGKIVDPRPPYAVYSAIGNIVIPVDQDPGHATFDPEITNYGLDVFAKQVLLGGDEFAFLGLQGTLVALNEVPFTINYGKRFLDMSQSFQTLYFADILSGQFENDGVQDLLFLAAFVSLFSSKAVFFSNFPNHLATPGAEFQTRPPSSIRTGWDIIGYKGPVGRAEESALRAKYADIEVLPGIDRRNPYL